MDSKICEQINNLVVEYFSKKDNSLLYQIEYLLKIQEYEAWKLKYDLRLIEFPDKFRKNKNVKNFESMFHHSNAYSKYHLILPLLVYLFENHKSSKSALNTSLSFMSSSKEYLKPGDFAKTKTGVQRFITNTRFASLELRNLGLLRSDSRRFYKYWELSLFGILLAGYIYLDYKNNLSNAFFNNFNWLEAKKSSFLVLDHYIALSQKPNNLEELFKSLFEEEIVSSYFQLYNRNFITFTKHIRKVIADNYNIRKQSTKDLVLFLNIINSDSEISKLADSIILRKDIMVNLNDVYKIISKDNSTLG